MIRINMCFADGWHPVPPNEKYLTYAEAFEVRDDHILFSQNEVAAGRLQEPLAITDFWLQSNGDFPGVGLGAEEYAAKHGWERVSWDGNPELGWRCWRKKFGRGTISVGCGVFPLIVHSFGANSDDSFSSTRIRVQTDTILSEAEAMKETDLWWSRQRQ